MYRLNALGIADKLELVNVDLSDAYNLIDVVKKGSFDEIYNLGAQSFVGASWDTPVQTSQVNALGPLYLLDAIRRFSDHSKYYQASTSEMFGLIREEKQSETTPFYPRSPYGVAKQFAHSMVVNYRESFGLHCTSGILFNHESPLRGNEFVTKKIARAFAEMALNSTQVLKLGNLNAKRDWGYAKDYVEGMWLMLQEAQPDDYVLATGETSSIRDFADLCAQFFGWSIAWEGEGIYEKGIEEKSGRTLVEVDATYFRPAEVEVLLGNPTKAEKRLGWKAKCSVQELARIMTEYEVSGTLN